MKLKPVISTALLLGVVIFLQSISTNEAVAQSANQKPYCTSASNQGVSWMRWGSNTVEEACFEVFTKLLNAGRSVDRGEWGYYKTNAQNIGQLSCIQGKKKVTGNGSDIFTEAMNMRQTLGWSGCTVKITN